MRMTRVIIAFSVLASSVVLTLWAADLIGGELATTSLKKVLLIVGILGGASSLIFGVLGVRKRTTQVAPPPNSGPRF